MELQFQITKGLSKADGRFICFIKKASFPITEAQIIAYYRQHVADRRLRSGKWVSCYNSTSDSFEWDNTPYTEKEIRQGALTWFDLGLGRAIRKQILLVPREQLMQANN